MRWHKLTFYLFYSSLNILVCFHTNVKQRGLKNELKNTYNAYFGHLYQLLVSVVQHSNHLLKLQETVTIWHKNFSTWLSAPIFWSPRSVLGTSSNGFCSSMWPKIEPGMGWMWTWNNNHDLFYFMKKLYGNINVISCLPICQSICTVYF